MRSDHVVKEAVKDVPWPKEVTILIAKIVKTKW